MTEKEAREFDYDYVVIGGGSGGLSSAKLAASLGARVAVFDYVKPSPRGSRWGLGGTCVNVGCIPKKLMHYAAGMQPLLGWDSKKMGWGEFEEIEEETGQPKMIHKQCDWQTLVQAVQSYIKQLNFTYRTGLRAAGCTYINALATIKGPNTIEYTEKDKAKTLTARYILVAVGGRPKVPAEVPGAAEFAVTSDDLFSLKEPPGKTLVVGASYIALECAGLLKELGFDVTVAVRSLLLRGFDRQCALKVGRCMGEIGVSFLERVLVSSVTENKRKGDKCNSNNNNTNNDHSKYKYTVALHEAENPQKTQQIEVDTVLYATGRAADTDGLNLEAVGVKLGTEGRIICDAESRTSVPSIFAVGDVVEGFPELTPAAIKAGEILARRLFGGSSEIMELEYIPTTVFTPVEYGCVGLSEEAAIAKYGASEIEVYLSEFQPLEVSACHRPKDYSARLEEADFDLSPICLSKLVCLKNKNYKVIGVHFVGPNAGEVIQGFAVAVRKGATKADFDSTVGIHPTNAENIVQLTITKSSGQNWVAKAGCGGGKCG